MSDDEMLEDSELPDAESEGELGDSDTEKDSW